MTDVRAIRLQLDLTQAELAERLGVTQGSISRLENGEQRLTRPLEIALLAIRDGFAPESRAA